MAYNSYTPKADNQGADKFFFLCQTLGCGATINPEFPVADKNPSPKHCKDCQDKETRELIKSEYLKIKVA